MDDESRLSTGIKSLDSLIGGGLPRDTVTLLSGAPGAGKTLFGLNFLLDGARKNEKCCYLSFSETPDDLLRACACIRSLNDAPKYIEKNLIFQHIVLEEMTLSKFMQTLMLYPHIDRLVVDNTNKLLLFSENERKYRLVLNQLIEYLRRRAVCSILINESGCNCIDSGRGESYDCDGVITINFQELEEVPRRILEIHKLRYTHFDPKVAHDFVITDKSIDISEKKLI